MVGTRTSDEPTRLASGCSRAGYKKAGHSHVQGTKGTEERTLLCLREAKMASKMKGTWAEV